MLLSFSLAPCWPPRSGTTALPSSAPAITAVLAPPTFWGVRALTGKPLTGVEAAEIGLINLAVPFERLEQEVAETARRLVHPSIGVPPHAVWIIPIGAPVLCGIARPKW